MRKLIRSLAAAAAAAAVLAPMAASAACTQANIAGRWNVYTFSVNGGQPAWVRCRIIVSATGSVTNTTCTAHTGQSLPLTGAHIDLTGAPICVYGGGFSLAGSANQLRHLTLSLDKQTASGVGVAPPAGAFTIEMVKTGS
jgi:hypothetical protein